MNKIFVFLILSAMVTTGHLTNMCKRCWVLDSTECCTEKETICNGTKCMMLSEYCNVSNVIYNTVKKMCAMEIMCDNCFSASTNHGFNLRVSGECREGNNSNADLKYKELCRDKLQLNGFMCPSCYVNTSTDGCESDEMVLCRGNELECMKYRGCVQLSGYLTTTCKRCWTLDSTECCTEKEVQCDGSQCMMISEYCNISNVVYTTVKKTCAFDSLCNNCYSASTNRDFFLRVSSECAVGDNSNANMKYKELCPYLLSPNNYKCPSCYVHGSTKGCKSKEMVLCGGNELECVEYRGVIQLSNSDVLKVSMQGCITKGGCEMGFGAIPGAKELKGILMKCTPAKPVDPAGDQ